MLLQNNLERQEYETKSRLTSQIDGLEQEVTVLKQKLTSEQNQSSKLIETLQVCKLMNINHLYYFRHLTSAVKILTYTITNCQCPVEIIHMSKSKPRTIGNIQHL